MQQVNHQTQTTGFEKPPISLLGVAKKIFLLSTIISSGSAQNTTQPPTPAPSWGVINGTIIDFVEKFNGLQDWKNVKIKGAPDCFYVEDMQDFGCISPAPEEFKVIKEQHQATVEGPNGDEHTFDIAKKNRGDLDFPSLTWKQRLGIKSIPVLEGGKFALMCKDKDWRYCTESDLERRVQKEKNIKTQFVYHRDGGALDHPYVFKNPNLPFELQRFTKEATYKGAPAQWSGIGFGAFFVSYVIARQYMCSKTENSSPKSNSDLVELGKITKL